MSLRLLLPRSVSLHQSTTRAFSTSTARYAPGDDLARQAEQRERALSKEAARKNELRKMARKRAEARANPERSPFFHDIPTALRYLRAAEVGRSPKDSVLTISTGVVSQKGTAKLSGSVMFPKPLKETKIIVFTSLPEQAEAAKSAGAKVVGGVELVEQIKSGELALDFDRAFATPEIASQLNAVARVLGPRGLMPSAKKGTVAEDVSALINEVSGSIPFRQKTEQVSIAVGCANFSDSEIVNNILAAYGALEESISNQKAKRPSILGQTVLQSTHGPGIVINIK